MVEHCTRRSRAQGPVIRGLALLLIVCLVECATGSCLSYGHSCWGAHGKRSGKPPASAPDWYLTRMLRRIVANGDMDDVKPDQDNSDITAIFRVEAPDETVETGLSNSEDLSAEITGAKRNPDGIPMLDEKLLSKAKFWQIMRAASEEK